MKLPNFRRIIKSDYETDDQKLIETLSFSLNNGIEVLYQALNRALTLQDNVACTVKEFTVEVDATGTPKSKTSFTLNTSNRILGVMVLNAINTKNPSILPTAGVFMSFYQEGKTVTINNIKGLPENQIFNLTTVSFEG
jgi:hypothetical protein